MTTSICKRIEELRFPRKLNLVVHLNLLSKSLMSVDYLQHHPLELKKKSKNKKNEILGFSSIFHKRPQDRVATPESGGKVEEVGKAFTSFNKKASRLQITLKIETKSLIYMSMADN